MDIFWVEIGALLVTTLLSVYVYSKWVYGFWKRRNIPYIEPRFPMGNTEPPWAIKKGLNGVMLDIYKEFRSKGYKHGGMYLTLAPTYVPVDLDLIKNILIKDFTHFVDRGLYFNEDIDPLSANLISMEGQKWKNLRAKLTPTFSSSKMKAMFQQVVDCGSQLEKEIGKLKDRSKPLNIREIGALFTTNVIGSCAFGLDCNCFEEPNGEFVTHGRRFFKGGLLASIRFIVTQSFPEICRMLGVRAFPKGLTDFYMGVTKDIINYREMNKTERNDFIKLLLDVRDKAKTKEESFTFNEMAAQAFVFFLAGFETSSSTMTFAFYELARHQDIQDKVREEIHRVMKKHDGKLTYEAVMEMTYMQQVFDETLRKHPVIPILARVCTKDYKIPNEDFILKKGMHLQISLTGIHNDPEYFPNPEEFDPERFTPENKAKLHPCAYMPFGEGPRVCIGLRFGIMQAKVGMAIMLKDYKYSISAKMAKLELDGTARFMQALNDVLLDIEKVN